MQQDQTNWLHEIFIAEHSPGPNKLAILEGWPYYTSKQVNDMAAIDCSA